MGKPLEILAIGAHPDDIEIGAGGTVARLTQDGHRVVACILTDEASPAVVKRRRRETAAALQSLGVRQEDIIFLGLKDSYLRADGSSVAEMRAALETLGVKPSIVLCHTSSDSHNDHTESATLALAVFRRCMFLHYPIVNSLVTNTFRPTVYVETTEYWGKKLHALQMHKTQQTLSRIRTADIEALELAAGLQIGAERAEQFELRAQHSAAGSELLRQLNGNSVTHFWSQLVRSTEVYYIYGTPPYHNRDKRDVRNMSARAALGQLKRVLEPAWTVQEIPENSEDSEELIANANLILEGGPVSNRFTGQYFNHIPAIQYVIDYDMPSFRNIRIVDRKRRTSICAVYEKNSSDQSPRVLRDAAVLSIIENPFDRASVWIGAMGIHSAGTTTCVRLLANGIFLRELATRVQLPLGHGVRGYQLIVFVDTQDNSIHPDWDSLREIRGAR